MRFFYKASGLWIYVEHKLNQISARGRESSSSKTLNGFDGLIIARKTRSSISPLQTEFQKKLCDEMYEESPILLCDICDRLFLIGENDFRTRKKTFFCDQNWM